MRVFECNLGRCNSDLIKQIYTVIGHILLFCAKKYGTEWMGGWVDGWNLEPGLGLLTAIKNLTLGEILK